MSDIDYDALPVIVFSHSLESMPPQHIYTVAFRGKTETWSYKTVLETFNILEESLPNNFSRQPNQGKPREVPIIEDMCYLNFPCQHRVSFEGVNKKLMSAPMILEFYKKHGFKCAPKHFNEYLKDLQSKKKQKELKKSYETEKLAILQKEQEKYLNMDFTEFRGLVTNLINEITDEDLLYIIRLGSVRKVKCLIEVLHNHNKLSLIYKKHLIEREETEILRELLDFIPNLLNQELIDLYSFEDNLTKLDTIKALITRNYPLDFHDNRTWHDLLDMKEFLPYLECQNKYLIINDNGILKYRKIYGDEKLKEFIDSKVLRLGQRAISLLESRYSVKF